MGDDNREISKETELCGHALRYSYKSSKELNHDAAAAMKDLAVSMKSSDTGLVHLWHSQTWQRDHSLASLDEFRCQGKMVCYKSGAESCPREGLDSYSASLLAWRSSKQEVNRKFIDRKQELESPSSSQHLSSIPSSGRFYWMKFAESCLQLCRAEDKGQDAVLRQEVDNQHSKDHSCLRPTSQTHRETLLS